MVDVATAFLFGMLVGGAFAVVRQPIPAPPTVAGAAGVIGVTLGFIAVAHYRR